MRNTLRMNRTLNLAMKKMIRKRRLLEEIINPKKPEATSSKKVSGPKPVKRSVNRSVLIGWIHCGKDKKPTRVGLEKGGGTRTLTATTDTTYEDLIKSGKEWFFPKGKCQFGSEKEMIFGLADFQRKTRKQSHGFNNLTIVMKIVDEVIENTTSLVSCISFMYVCMVNTIYLLSFVETHSGGV